MKNLIRSAIAVFLTVLFCSLQQKENTDNTTLVEQVSDLNELINNKTTSFSQARDIRLKQKLKK
ncbi:MAG: hypothetical protein QM499_12090 [Flavobacteriaceae bacterium]